jgi:hypothetical protein
MPAAATNAIQARGNPLFAGVDTSCTELLGPTGVDGVAAAVLSPATQSRESAYATDDVAQKLDELQYTIGEGPCFDAYLDDRPQFYPRLDSVGDAPRWPTFAADATHLGVRALFALPIPDGRRPMGALELYRHDPGRLTDSQHDSASACATAIAARLQANWDSCVCSPAAPIGRSKPSRPLMPSASRSMRSQLTRTDSEPIRPPCRRTGAGARGRRRG